MQEPGLTAAKAKNIKREQRQAWRGSASRNRQALARSYLLLHTADPYILQVQAGRKFQEDIVHTITGIKIV